VFGKGKSDVFGKRQSDGMSGKGWSVRRKLSRVKFGRKSFKGTLINCGTAIVDPGVSYKASGL